MAEKLLIAGTTKSRIRYLWNDVWLYGAASALVPLVGLIAVPLLTHNLDAPGYGVFELAVSYVGLAVIIGGVGQDSAFARYYYDNDDPNRRRQIINQAFWTQLVASLVTLLVFIVVGGYFFSNISAVRNLYFLLSCAAFSIPCVVGFNFVRNVLKWTFLRKQYVMLTFLYSGLVLAGYYVLVVLLNLGPSGAVSAQGGAALAAAIGGLWFLRGMEVGKRQRAFSLPMFKYGLPYVMLGIFSQGFRALDKSILVGTAGLEAAAIYAVGFKIATLILVLESTFNMAWGPIAMAIHKEKDSIHTYDIALVTLGWVLSGAFLVLSYLSNWIVSFVAPSNYFGAASVAVIICIGFVMQSLAGVSAVGIELAKKPKLLIFSWGVGVATATVLMLLLAPPLGTIGVALGVSAGLILESIIRTACAYSVYPFRFRLADGLKPLIVAIAMIILANYLDQNSQILKMMFGLLFGVMGYVILRRKWLHA